MGTHTVTPATSGQVSATARLLRGIGDQYGIEVPNSSVLGPRDQSSTTCPGNALYAQLPEIIAGAGYTPPPPPPTTGSIRGFILHPRFHLARRRRQ